MVVLSKLVNIIEIFYKTLIKSAVFYLFKIYYGSGKRYHLNCIDDVILAKSASELAEEIRNRKITSVIVLKAYIKRIKEIQPALNCVVDERFEEALEDAYRIDKLIEENSINDLLKLPLLGIPFTCSESICVKGMKNSVGLVCRKSIKADNDADVIKLMKNAGAILLCITNMSELGLWIETSNRVYGTTKNPYDIRRIAGGSAGGEASLISGCGSLIGLGIDFNGGIRLSASFNGIFAHKPTNDLINKNGFYPNGLTINQNNLLSIGPLCRYSQDLNLLMDVLCIDDENGNSRLIPFTDKLDLKNLNFFYIDSIDAPFVSKSSNDVKHALVKLVKFFETNSGNPVKRLNSKYLSKAFNMFISLIKNNIDRYQLNKLITDNKTTENLFIELFYNMLGMGKHTLPTLTFSLLEAIFAVVDKEETNKYFNIIEQLRGELDTLLGHNGVILLPTFPATAPFHHQSLWTNTIDSVVYCGLFNVLGFPSTQVCGGLNNDKLPIGIQLISNRYCDNLTIKLANLIEYIHGGWCEPC